MGTETRCCQNKDIFERMNYLYQASHLMALKDRAAASYYSNMMMGCARKAVLRIEPDLKRTICKFCQTVLIPGETAKVRITRKPMKGINWTCLICRSTKRFPTTKGYKLWVDQPGAIVEVLDYTPKSKKKTQQSSPQEKTVNLPKEIVKEEDKS